MVTPKLVAPPGSLGSFTKPPSRATISFAIWETLCIASISCLTHGQGRAKRLTRPCLTARCSNHRKIASASALAAIVVFALGLLIDALRLQAIDHLFGHVILIVLGKDLGRREKAVAIAAHANHALIFFKQIR